MSSEIDVCNMALSNIRGGSINSLDEGSAQSKLCKLKYPLLRDALLRDAPWQFAHKVKPLALTTIDAFNWAFTYQYPSDCLAVNRLILNIEDISQNGASEVVSRARFPEQRIIPLDNQVEYEVRNVDGNRVITANEKELRIDYRAKVTDVNLFDSEFFLTLSHLLASELAVPIIGGKVGRDFRADEITLYRGYLNSAIESDLNEQYHPQQESEFITVRQ